MALTLQWREALSKESSEHQPLLVAEKTHISPWPQRLSALESHSSRLHTLIMAYQVLGTGIVDMAATLQSEGGKEVFIENLLCSKHFC